MTGHTAGDAHGKSIICFSVNLVFGEYIGCIVMSPTWIMPGKRRFVTSMGKVSISDAHTGVMPLRTAAKGNPPIPSNRLPMVICVDRVISSPFHLIAAAMVRVVLTAACAV